MLQDRIKSRAWFYACHTYYNFGPCHLTWWAFVLLHVIGLWTPPPRTWGFWCCHVSRSSEPHSTSGVGSDAAACPIALDHTSLPKRALVLPHVHGSLWTMGIKKCLVVLYVQRGARHARMLPRCLQNMRVDNTIMTRKTFGYAATVSRYNVTPRDWSLSGTISRGLDPKRTERHCKPHATW
jgi:hypothetical protein